MKKLIEKINEKNKRIKIYEDTDFTNEQHVVFMVLPSNFNEGDWHFFNDAEILKKYNKKYSTNFSDIRWDATDDGRESLGKLV
jgi:hypothetical protein